MSTEVEHIMIIFLFFDVYSLLLGWPHLKLGQLRALPSTWLAMSGFVSVGSTPQTTAIFVCHPHVKNVVLTRRGHSLMSANFSSAGVVSVRPVADTHSCMNVGFSINQVVTYEDKKKLASYLVVILSDLVIHLKISQQTRHALTLSKSN